MFHLTFDFNLIQVASDINMLELSVGFSMTFLFSMERQIHKIFYFTLVKVATRSVVELMCVRD